MAPNSELHEVISTILSTKKERGSSAKNTTADKQIGHVNAVTDCFAALMAFQRHWMAGSAHSRTCKGAPALRLQGGEEEDLQL